MELFELERLGGVAGARLDTMRPEAAALPWSTLSVDGLSPESVAAARRAWTNAAFQEFRTGAACAATLRALFEARAPLDLIGLFSRFPLDEVVHVGLCARLATALGGGAPIAYEPRRLVEEPPGEEPVLRAAHLVVAHFCVGEGLSIPLLHGTWRAATHPLVREVLRIIVEDEADHGQFGWVYLDWALPHLDSGGRRALAETAGRYIAGVRLTWNDLKARRQAPIDEAHALGWLGTDAYLELADRSLSRQVLGPLRERGLA